MPGQRDGDDESTVHGRGEPQTGTFAVAESRGGFGASLHDIANTVAVIAVDVAFLRERLEGTVAPDVRQTLDELLEATVKLRALLEGARRQLP